MIPNIVSLEEMKEHHAILTFGNGKHYPGKNTLRDWLRQVDPRSPKVKNGRPRTVT